MPAFDPYVHVIKPMLAESRETPFDSKDHIFELKWDGTRALAIVRNGHRFQNRRLNYVESRYPDLKIRTRKDAILDGEIVVMVGSRVSRSSSSGNGRAERSTSSTSRRPSRRRTSSSTSSTSARSP